MQQGKKGGQRQPRSLLMEMNPEKLLPMEKKNKVFMQIVGWSLRTLSLLSSIFILKMKTRPSADRVEKGRRRGINVWQTYICMCICKLFNICVF